MCRTQYIFIDYENVTESDLTRIRGKAAQVFMILGNRHTKLPTSLALYAQAHPGQVRFVQTPVDGRNALDLVLALELGRILATDPHGYFHIVAKDTDYESVVRHLKADNRLIARHTKLAHIPALRTTEERLAAIKAELWDASRPRPASRNALENKIRSALGNQVDTQCAVAVIDELIRDGLLSFTGTGKALYNNAA